MATVEKISIALTEDLAALVRKVVESGDSASTSELIRDALRDRKLKRTARDEQAAALRHRWQEGIDSCVAGPLDIEAINREARTLLEKIGR